MDMPDVAPFSIATIISEENLSSAIVDLTLSALTSKVLPSAVPADARNARKILNYAKVDTESCLTDDCSRCTEGRPAEFCSHSAALSFAPLLADTSQQAA